jgi:hypothetical protein
MLVCFVPIRSRGGPGSRGSLPPRGGSVVTFRPPIFREAAKYHCEPTLTARVKSGTLGDADSAAKREFSLDG